MNRNRKINSNDDGDDGQSKRERQKRKLVEGMKSASRKQILTDEAQIVMKKWILFLSRGKKNKR
ncbi:hypothetical protein ACS0TY_004358 [Phlomoides rotata]